MVCSLKIESFRCLIARTPPSRRFRQATTNMRLTVVFREPGFGASRQVVLRVLPAGQVVPFEPVIGPNWNSFDEVRGRHWRLCHRSDWQDGWPATADPASTEIRLLARQTLCLLGMAGRSDAFGQQGGQGDEEIPFHGAKFQAPASEKHSARLGIRPLNLKTLKHRDLTKAREGQPAGHLVRVGEHHLSSRPALGGAVKRVWRRLFGCLGRGPTAWRQQRKALTTDQRSKGAVW